MAFPGFRNESPKKPSELRQNVTEKPGTSGVHLVPGIKLAGTRNIAAWWLKPTYHWLVIYY